MTTHQVLSNDSYCTTLILNFEELEVILLRLK